MLSLSNGVHCSCRHAKWWREANEAAAVLSPSCEVDVRSIDARIRPANQHVACWQGGGQWEVHNASSFREVCRQPALPSLTTWRQN